MIAFLFFGTLVGIMIGVITTYVGLKIYHYRIMTAENPFKSKLDLENKHVAPEDAPSQNKKNT